MALANDMSLLLNKIERRLGLAPLVPHLPEFATKDKWADVIKEDTMVTFSRYFPNKFPLVINENTCDIKMERGTRWYYIKDDVLQGVKLLGMKDIDWMDKSWGNGSSLGGGYFYPAYACPVATFESMMMIQAYADFMSLYNYQVYVDFEYPNRFSLKGLGNSNFDALNFVVILLVEHCSLSTISPTKMETFESLAISDVANFLYMNLRYYDGFETAYVNIDLKLSELQSVADKRDSIIDEMKNSYVSTANDNIPYIWTV